MAKTDDDQMLINLVSTGDREAMRLLYERHYDGLFAFLRGRGADTGLANDTTQEAMLQIWRTADKFAGKSSVKTWIYTIGRNKLIDRQRKNTRLSFVDDVPDTADPTPNPEALLMAANEASRVRACLEKLKPDHRNALRLAFYEDLSYEEISGLEDIPVGTVKTRIFHAKRLLLRCLVSK
ncbi:RNA polymerase sigma-70 factor (ECF subfamily) [Litoreibacter meonggei]|uniref:RNA polymerase sigma-70 factor (ECF subfamily) n=1 Tax=Litoreibacter meonggei TaxID=1049199 RepID=A0A497VW35_9RHOB|nr:sigma-70 family RNA polymerase sigma factor [Litoreibacter meonggei]RLJ41033.1 RNA polymerase sigma-70 factor (ECF subfamily) [Litoreibacter meonggei]